LFGRAMLDNMSIYDTSRDGCSVHEIYFCHAREEYSCLKPFVGVIFFSFFVVEFVYL